MEISKHYKSGSFSFPSENPWLNIYQHNIALDLKIQVIFFPHPSRTMLRQEWDNHNRYTCSKWEPGEEDAEQSLVHENSTLSLEFLWLRPFPAIFLSS